MQYEDDIDYSPDDSSLFDFGESMITSPLQPIKFLPNKF